jgi:phosphatidate cytidylyltransferase
MLKQRVITGIVLVLVLLGVVFYANYLSFVIALSLVFVLGGREWANLAGLKAGVLQWVYAIFLGLLFGGFYLLAYELEHDVEEFLLYLFIPVLIFWLTMLLYVKQFPHLPSFFNTTSALLFIGVFVLIPPWLGLVYLKALEPAGELVLTAIAIIAIADTGAYFSGKKFAKNKLAPELSPGKTIEGVIGGLVFNAVFVAAMSWYLDFSTEEILVFLVAALLTAAFSVLGDLFESLMKRHVGVKDSGALLPGHGGVLDRIDGWTAAMPVFVIFCLLFYSS